MVSILQRMGLLIHWPQSEEKKLLEHFTRSEEPSPTSCLRSYFKGRRRPRPCLSGRSMRTPDDREWGDFCFGYATNQTCDWTAQLNCHAFLSSSKKDACGLNGRLSGWWQVSERVSGAEGRVVIEKVAELWGWGVDSPTPWKPKVRSILELMLFIHNFLWMMNAMAKTCFIPVFEKCCNC